MVSTMSDVSNVQGLLNAGAAELARQISAGNVSSRDVVRAHIDRIEEVTSLLNAVVVRRYGEALDEADSADAAISEGRPLGPLHGVPVTLKEQLLVRDTPTTWGLAGRAGHVADREGTLVQALRAAGAVTVAKSNVPQLLIAHETDNALYGRTLSPWSPDRSPGGSSGGESALVAAFASPLGIGGDMGGSIRIPAHFSGIQGLKPTAGRLAGDDSDAGILPFPELMYPQHGPLARNVSDIALAMKVLAQPMAHPDWVTPPVPWQQPAEPDVRGLRIAVQEGQRPLFTIPCAPPRRARRRACARRRRGGTHRWSPCRR